MRIKNELKSDQQTLKMDKGDGGGGVFKKLIFPGRKLTIFYSYMLIT